MELFFELQYLLIIFIFVNGTQSKLIVVKLFTQNASFFDFLTTWGWNNEKTVYKFDQSISNLG